VGRNIFLDGNTFQASPHVHKKIMVGTLQVGGVLIYKETRMIHKKTRCHPEPVEG
jgi:hypothetical protein